MERIEVSNQARVPREIELRTIRQGDNAHENSNETSGNVSSDVQATGDTVSPIAASQTPLETSGPATPVSADSRTSLERIYNQTSAILLEAQSDASPLPQETPQGHGGSPQGEPSGSPPNGQQTPQMTSSIIARQRHSQSGVQRLGSFISEMKSQISLVVVFTITVGIIYTSPSADAPLAKAGITSGFLVLNILALANAYTFLAASDKVWERLQWGELLGGGEHLTTFLALNSSTGLTGWTRMLFRRRKYNTAGHPRIWSALRIACWMLVQLPGLIFLTIVNPTYTYLPMEWRPISGGLGVFNATVSTSKVMNGPLLSGLVINMLRDATITKEVDPISEQCKKNSTCVSYIVPGGLKTISPWPYNKTSDETLSAYITRGAPAYQVDFWKAPNEISWASDACQIYGESASAFQLCMASYGKKQIVAGWRPCVGKVTTEGDCVSLSWNNAPLWSTFVAVYRRNVTTAADRKTNAILDISEFGAPVSQDITIEDFSLAFDSMLCRWTNSSANFGCSAASTEWQLTQWVMSALLFDGAAPFTSDPLDYLRNLFMTPLYLYNIMIDGIGLSPVPSISEIPSGVPAENLIRGSLARPVNHLVVQRWTVVTYIAIGGFLVFLVLELLVSTIGRQVQKTSDFPALDFATLSVVKQESKEHPEIPSTFNDLFDECESGDNEKILEQASKARVYSKG